jgi:hypothetical protein
MKGFRENILDFEIIPTGNPKTLVFVDSSNYIGQPDGPRLQILLPGYNKFFLTNVVAKEVNTYNSNTIGFTDLLNNDCLLDLPDGVYQFKFEICPYQANYKIKSICRTTLLEQRLIAIYEKIEVSDCSRKKDEKIMNDLSEILMLIEGSHLVADTNCNKATEFYQLASKLTDRLIKKLEKCCN